MIMLPYALFIIAIMNSESATIVRYQFLFQRKNVMFYDCWLKLNNRFFSSDTIFFFERARTEIITKCYLYISIKPESSL
jgi:hypothetical protein